MTLRNYLYFIRLLTFLFHVCNRTYRKKINYFRHITRNTNNPVMFQKKASVKELLNNAARVCNLHCRVAFDISSKSIGEIAVSVPDELLQNAAMHEGYLAQANHLLSTGFNFHELIELEGAICEVEHENGSTCTDLYGDLRMNNDSLSRAAAQRGQKSGLDGAAALSIAVGGGGGGGDPHAMGSGQEGAQICTCMERVALPEQWPFAKTPEHKNNVEDMVSRVRILAMTKMINTTLTASAWKKACTVQTALAKNDETYVSIVKDLLPPSQDLRMFWMSA